ncbi:uncharacterized protein G6M90_00g030830 [Metarhizium brunneum]|uniref:Uncharacterized protein n=1 Tax=Metarhizium brunneum TaxID=500148 RepID=A0A7D5Z2B3_9HYPO|nr:hypothetical protein G6M90_00g030830 [Metarhizium brunneum]
MCFRERKAHEQLTLLLQFLDEHVMAEFRAERAQQEGLLYSVFDNPPGDWTYSAWKLLKKQCKYYKGKSRRFPFNEVDGLVMTDLKTYYAKATPPDLMEDTDCRNWVTDCVCAACRERNSVSTRKQIAP